jgi:hypothetical protein
MINAFEATQLPDSEQPETPKPRESGVQPTSPEKKEKAPDHYEKRTKELLAKSRELDMELHFLLSGDPMETTMKIQRLEALAFGKEVVREGIGDQAGKNAITRRVFESGNEKLISYVKPRGGEVTFRFDEATGHALQGSRFYNETTGRMELQEEVIADPNTEMTDDQKREHQYLWQRNNELPFWRTAIAKRYGIPVEDVPISETTGYRDGVEANGGAAREYFMNRLDLLIGFDVTLLTGLRKEHNGADVSSAQEAFLSADPKQNIQAGIDDKLFFELVDHGENHPAAKSLMRGACFHWLTKQSDGHPGNALYDPASKTFKFNDNGISMGLDAALDAQTPDGKTTTQTRPRDIFISIPTEIIDKHPDWKLDDEARDNLRQLFGSFMEYHRMSKEIETRRKERIASGKPIDPDEERREDRMKEAHGREVKYFTKLFRFLHSNEKIADIEGGEMLKKIKYLIDHGRPPYITRGGNGGELHPLEGEYSRENIDANTSTTQAA